MTFGGIGIYMVVSGQAIPGEPMFVDELTPSLEDSVFQFGIGLALITAELATRFYCAGAWRAWTTSKRRERELRSPAWITISSGFDPWLRCFRLAPKVGSRATAHAAIAARRPRESKCEGRRLSAIPYPFVIRISLPRSSNICGRFQGVSS